MSEVSRRPNKVAKFATTLAVAGAFLGLAEPAMAAEELNSGDTAWMLTSSLLVLLMTVPGVALFYGGMVRKKNVLATLMQSFAVCCMATIIWMVIGYSLAFSGEGPFVGDLGQVFLMGIGVDSMSGTIPESVFMMFQMTFAIITPALITGAVAERIKFSSLMVFLGLWLVVVYAPICHWVWGGGGFLGGAGVLDFAGGTVVHINSGVAALVLCLVLGKRIGYGRENLAPHNLVLTIIGASLLWVGWFGFNAGSELAADGNAGMAMAVTQIAAAAAALAWMFAEWFTRGKPSVLGIASGAVAGLVAITPAAGFVLPSGALALGLLAGFGCFFAVMWLKHKLGYDDALDVFGVHGIGGIIGAVLTGVFAVEAVGGTPGLLEGNGAQVGLQLYGIGVTIAYSAIVTFILIKLVGAVMGLRVEEDEEREGLDVSLHGESIS
ncbi:MAG: ammonium transporter [Rhodospirillaceae bacterium]|jgi:ammonium transporter, Amt family|nr:ammonium transporter [Rhodospirillaceae bacterium]MBT4689332.1 ammonium transporter [Rhodospirillaceae bacterium]MBT5084033.1 ammonium transporter [Rhodospirillaceae bacterium]MBT5523943.1 ammonium transporter [Rhodospirillaceae bacterium]MBT5882154.1 ammonium transporter [Rhodospirillaceae bacterium]